MRRCRLSTCRLELPKAKDSDRFQKAGFCNVDHMAAHGMVKARAIRARQAKAKDAEHKAIKRKVIDNDHAKQFDLTKKVAQKLARLLDDGKGCICCGTTKPVQYCGAHFKTAGGHPELALDLRNIHMSCNARCNMHLSGNIEGTKTTKGYRAGLTERYGKDLVEWLESYHPTVKRSCDDLRALRKQYNAEIRRIEQGQGPSQDWRQLPEQLKQECAA